MLRNLRNFSTLLQKPNLLKVTSTTSNSTFVDNKAEGNVKNAQPQSTAYDAAFQQAYKNITASNARFIAISKLPVIMQEMRHKFFVNDQDFINAIQYLPDSRVFAAYCSLQVKDMEGKASHKLQPSHACYVPNEETPGILSQLISTLEAAKSSESVAAPVMTHQEMRILESKASILSHKLQKTHPDSVVLQKHAGYFGNEFAQKVYHTRDTAAYFQDMQRKGGVDISTIPFIYQPILHGINFSLIYKDGQISEASTLDLGENNTDITALIRSISNGNKSYIPSAITHTEEVQVMGKMVLDIVSLNLLNISRIKAGHNPWNSTRDAIIDAIINESPNKSLELKLKCYFDYAQTTPMYHQDMASPIYHNILPYLPRSYTTKGSWLTLPQFVEKMSTLPYDCVGIRIIPNAQDKFIPTKQCIYLPLPKFTETTISHISSICSEDSGGLFIQNIHTADQSIISFSDEKSYTALQPQIGSQAIIAHSMQRASKPHILTVIERGNQKYKPFPTECPTCKSPAVTKTAGNIVNKYCPTHYEACRSGLIEEIERCYSIDGLYIPSLSKEFVTYLVQKLLVHHASDIMHLTPRQLSEIPNGTFDFDQLLEQINCVKHTTLERLIYAILPCIDTRQAQELASKLGTVESLQSISKKELMLHGVDSITAQKIYDLMSDTKTLYQIENFIASGVSVAVPNEQIQFLLAKPIEAYGPEDFDTLQQEISRCDEDRTRSSDYQYDSMTQKMSNIEATRSELLPKVPKKIIKSRSKVKHDDICADYSKSTATKSAEDFCSTLAPRGIVVEPKVDGIGCFLSYENGKLIVGFSKETRNKDGHDITDVIRTCKQVPQELHKSFTGTIRGELYISKSNWHKISEKSEYKSVNGCLNAVLNSNGRCSNDITDKINFFAFEVEANVGALQENGKRSIYTRSDLYKFLQELGFSSELMKDCVFFDRASQAISYLRNKHALQRKSKTQIDGVVIKPQNMLLEQETGETTLGHYYKFPLSDMTTEIESISIRVKSDSRIHATAKVKEVQFSNGNKVKKIVINDHRLLKDICEGDKVVVCYEGGASPHLQTVLIDQRPQNATQIAYPSTCTNCNSKLALKNKTLVCNNKKCSTADEIQYILSFAKVLHMQPQLVKKLLDSDVINDLEDLLSPNILETLQDTDILTLSQRQKLLEALVASKSATTSQWLQAMNVRGAGRETLSKITEKNIAFEDLVKMSVQTMQEKYGIANVQASRIHSWLEQNKELVESIREFIGDQKQVGQSIENAEELHKKIKDIVHVNSAAKKTVQEILELYLLQAEKVASAIASSNDPEVVKLYKQLNKYIASNNQLVEILSNTQALDEQTLAYIDRAEQDTPRQEYGISTMSMMGDTPADSGIC